MKQYECEFCQDTYVKDNGLDCNECCPHEFDADEGYTCLNCGEQQDMGELIDAAEYQYGDR